MADQPSYPVTPRWVKVQAIFVVGLVLLVIGMSAGVVHLEGGGHGQAVDTAKDHTPPEGSQR